MSKRLTTDEFIKRATEVHGDTYDYSLVKYINSRTKIKIICRKHGIFEQEPTNHTYGYGCNACGQESTVKNNRRTRVFDTKSFISRSIEIHGSRYDYSKVKYIGTKYKVEIVCPDHGSFFQAPNTHLNGYGCRGCFQGAPDPIKYGERAEFSFIYVIKLSLDYECFYKIGIAKSGVKRRYRPSKLPYTYEVIREIKMSGYGARMCEIELHRVFKSKKYVPNIWFRGYTECFETLDLNSVDEVITWFQDTDKEGI